jgi:DNA-binding NarL/FixJ family response regulator
MEPCRVLIADDNLRARFALRVLLSLRTEIEVVGEAADGLAAVDMVRDCQPSVVLMDVRMPRLDGLDATRRMKAIWPETRIVLTSMVASHRAEALAAGADAFLVKGEPGEILATAILGQL